MRVLNTLLPLSFLLFLKAHDVRKTHGSPDYNVVTLNPQTSLWQGTGDTSKIYEKMRESSTGKRQT